MTATSRAHQLDLVPARSEVSSRATCQAPHGLRRADGPAPSSLPRPGRHARLHVRVGAGGRLHRAHGRPRAHLSSASTWGGWLQRPGTRAGPHAVEVMVRSCCPCARARLQTTRSAPPQASRISGRRWRVPESPSARRPAWPGSRRPARLPDRLPAADRPEGGVAGPAPHAEHFLGDRLQQLRHGASGSGREDPAKLAGHGLLPRARRHHAHDQQRRCPAAGAAPSPRMQV